VSEMDEKLNTLLSDPGSMARIMQLAQQLSGTMGGAEKSTPEPPPPPPLLRIRRAEGRQALADWADWTRRCWGSFCRWRRSMAAATAPPCSC